MKIAICGSMVFSKEMLQAKKTLELASHECSVPRHTEEYAEMAADDHIHNESVKNKINNDLIRFYYKIIAESDAVFIINESRHNIENYIGGNSFLEMGFAHILHKKIFLLNPIPEMIYTDEIKAMNPIILNGDLTKIK